MSVKQQAAINIVPNPSGMIAECGDGVLGWVKCIAQEHVDGWVHITIAVRPSQMQVMGAGWDKLPLGDEAEDAN